MVKANSLKKAVCFGIYLIKAQPRILPSCLTHAAAVAFMCFVARQVCYHLPTLQGLNGLPFSFRTFGDCSFAGRTHARCPCKPAHA